MQITPLLGRYGATDHQGRYLHWDKFLWRVEKGVGDEEAWLATKIARKAITKLIPQLKGYKNSDNFSYCIPDSLFAQLHHIDKIPVVAMLLVMPRLFQRARRVVTS